jgi:predicted AAA+ superfamily ATPase
VIAINRLLQSEVRNYFNKGKALVITGARQVGKTTMLKDLIDADMTVLWLNADEQPVRDRLAEASVKSLAGVIGKYKTVVIDEVQRIENAGLILKLLIDNFKDVQFIATGSSALDISETIFEPLTGRHILFHLYPFSLTEMYSGKSVFEIERELPFHLVFGSYPEVATHREDAKMILKNLADQYLYKDVLVWKDIRKPVLLDNLLKLLAYQVGSEVSVHELAGKLKVKSETVESYIDLLEKSFVVFRLHAYSTNQRNEVTKMTKIYFWDNGIRNAIIDRFEPLSSRNDHGILWENFMISERQKWNNHREETAKSYFWRNYNQSEVDYVEMENGKLSAFEMKWQPRKNAGVTRAFTNQYPDANTAVVSPQNFTSFCGLA